MTRVLGIDQSLTGTGLCRVDILDRTIPDEPNTPPWISAIDVLTLASPKPKDKTKREYSRRISAVVNAIEDALEDVDLVAMEEIAYGAKGAAAWVLPWLFGRIIDLCERHDKQLIVVNVTCVKKYATGSGNAPKDQVMLAVARRWPEVRISNNNEADALICAAVGCRHLGLPIDMMPAKHLEFMSKISA